MSLRETARTSLEVERVENLGRVRNWHEEALEGVRGGLVSAALEGSFRCKGNRGRTPELLSGKGHW